MDQLISSTPEWVATNPTWMGIMLFATALTESLAGAGIVMPGVVMIFGFGTLIALDRMEFRSSWALATADAATGDGASSLLGKRLSEHLRGCWPFLKYPDVLSRSEKFITDHDGKSELLGRFIRPLRPVVSAIASMMHRSGRVFLRSAYSLPFSRHPPIYCRTCCLGLR